MPIRIFNWFLRHRKTSAGLLIFLFLIILGNVEEIMNPTPVAKPVTSTATVTPQQVQPGAPSATPRPPQPTPTNTKTPQPIPTTVSTATVVVLHAYPQMTAMAALDPQTGDIVIQDRLVTQCDASMNDVLNLLNPVRDAFTAHNLTQDLNFALEEISHIQQNSTVPGIAGCQASTQDYIHRFFSQEQTVMPALPPLGHHVLKINISNEIYLDDYLVARVVHGPVATCSASVYYTDGTSPKPSAWDTQANPRRQSAGDYASNEFGWSLQVTSAAYGGWFVVNCTTGKAHYAAKAYFDILPVYWPQ